MSNSDSAWSRHEKCDDKGAWSSDAERTSLPLSSWQRPSNVDILQMHDTWRSQQDGFDVLHLHTLRVLTLMAPVPSRSAPLLLPSSPTTAGRTSRPPTGLRGYHGAGSAAASSAILQLGPVPRMLMSGQKRTFLELRHFLLYGGRWLR